MIKLIVQVLEPTAIRMVAASAKSISFKRIARLSHSSRGCYLDTRRPALSSSAAQRGAQYVGDLEFVARADGDGELAHHSVHIRQVSVWLLGC